MQKNERKMVTEELVLEIIEFPDYIIKRK